MKERTTKITLLVIILTLGITTLPIQTIQADSLGNLHGTVVDETGNPIENVKVSAYLGTGSLADTEKTDEEGYFRMNLGGTYTLVFEKEGYVVYEKNIQVTQAPTENPDQDIVKLGEIILQSILDLSASVVKRYTTPGNILTLEFTVSNNGDSTEDVTFSVIAPEEWDVKILDKIGEIENILIDSGSEGYSLEVNIPETATQIETITLIASGSITASLEFTITPKVYTDEVKLESTYLSVSEEKGQDIELPLIVLNIGEVDKKVTLSGDVPSGWEVTFKTSKDMAVTGLLLTPDQSESLTIELTTPDDVAVGDYNLVFEAEDVNGGILDTLEIEVNLREATSEVEVISSFSEVSVEAGGSITFPLVIWNKGEADALTLFTVPVLPSNWDVSFVTDDLEVASIRIPGGESESVDLIVTPPSSVTSDVYDLLVVIETDDVSQHEIEYTVEVVGSYELELEMSTLYTTSSIGNSVTYSAKVTNQGQTAVTTLYLETVIPDDWTVTVTPTQVSSLEPRDSVTYTIVVELPGDTEAGDYLLTSQAISDQLESDEIDVRITANASSTWGYIGVGIAIVAVAGASLLFRRFKRR
jgi:uncharacterized membrane protein